DFVVDNISDVVDNDLSDGNRTLREALSFGANVNNISFDASLSGQTITLNGTALDISYSVNINGDIDDDGVADITIDGDNLSQAFNIDDNNDSNQINVNIEGININNSAGIYNQENLTIENSNISNNQASVSKVLSLDGVNDYVSIPDSDAIDFAHNENFTIESWFKADLTQPDTGNGDNDIIEKWGSAGGAYSYVIRYIRATGQILVARYDGTNNPAITSTATINDGEFHHIAFVRNGNTLELYIDGVLDRTTDDTTTGNTENNHPLFVGSREGDNFFKGEVSELRIWNTNRTQAQIQDNLYKELTGNESNLVAYYNFNDGTANDLTANNNNGTLIGGATTQNSKRLSGGAIYNDIQGNLVINNSTLDNNASEFFGGAIANIGGRTTITSTTLSNNSSAVGGAIYNTGTLDITQSTISTNTASNSGGGIYNSSSSSLNLLQSTISDNSVNGITNLGSINLKNNIIANTSSGADIQNTGTINTIAVNLVEDGSLTGSNIINQDPKLSPLQNNRGANKTHVPLAGSPAINRVTDTTIIGTITPTTVNTVNAPSGTITPTTVNTVNTLSGEFVVSLNQTIINDELVIDQRGFARKTNEIADLGAVESDVAQFIVDTLVDEDDGDYSPGDRSLREMIALSPDGGTIIFDASLANQTITLGGTELLVDKSLTIDGATHNITIDANYQSNVFNLDDGDNNSLSDIVIEGLNIVNSNIIDPRRSAGIYSRENFTLRNVEVTGNQWNGIINAFSSNILANTVVIENSNIYNNNTFNLDGAGFINLNQANITITNSQFTNNLLRAFYNTANNINLTISNSDFTNNQLGIYLPSGENAIVHISNSRFNDSDIISDKASSNVTIDNTVMSNNVVALSNSGNMIVTNSLIYNNTNIFGTAGLFNSGNLQIINTTISNNSGHLNNIGNQGILTILNSTIADNSSFYAIDNKGTLNITSSIISGHTSGRNGRIINNTGTATSGGNNIFGDNTMSNFQAFAGFTLLSSDFNATTDGLSIPVRSIIAPLADNGGSTLSHLVIPDGIARDNGSNPNILTTDQIGNPRVQGDGIDVGATEFIPKIEIVPTINAIDENTNTTSAIKVADINILDGSFTASDLSLDGAMSSRFSLVDTELFLATNQTLDFEMDSSLSVNIKLDDNADAILDDFATYNITINDINEVPTAINLTSSQSKIQIDPQNITFNFSSTVDNTVDLKVADINISDDALGTENLRIVGTDASKLKIVGNELFINANSLNGSVLPLEFTIEVNDDTVGSDPDLLINVSVLFNTFVVDTLEDNVNGDLTRGDRSLREVLNLAQDGASITFDSNLLDEITNKATITLNGSEIGITKSVTIDGDLNNDGIADVILSANSNSQRIFNIDDGTVAIKDVTLEGLEMTGVVANNIDRGIAILNKENLTIRNSVVADNLSNTSARGTVHSFGNLTVENTTFDNNELRDDTPRIGGDNFDSFGGAINIEKNAPVDLNIINSTFSNNNSISAKGIIHSINANQINIVNSTFGKNASFGGVIYGENIIIDITHSTFTENVSSSSALIFLGYDSTLNVTNSIFTDNGRVAYNFSLFGNQTFNPTLNLRGTNLLTSDLGLGRKSINGVSQSLEEIIDTSNIINQDALLQPLQNNGGNTFTYALSESSPAIDAADPTYSIATDQRGISRFTGFGYDLGAVELTSDGNPIILLGNKVNTLEENLDTANPVKVADIYIADDGVGTNNLSLSGNDANKFKIMNNQLFIKQGVVLDFESQNQLNVTVNLDDPAITGNPDSSVNYQLTLTDGNDAPVVTFLQGISTFVHNIPEYTIDSAIFNQPTYINYTWLGQSYFRVIDDSSGLTTVRLTGADADYFSLSSSEKVHEVEKVFNRPFGERFSLYFRNKDGKTFDYEENVNGNRFDVTIEVDEQGIGNTPDVSFTETVFIYNLNEAPTDILFDNLSIDENNIGGVISNLSVVDEDHNETFTYLQVYTKEKNGNGFIPDNRFEITNNQLKLKAGQALDFENESEITFYLTVRDSGNRSYFEEITIGVNDVNESPTNITLDNESVNENATGAVIGNLDTSDVDNEDTFTYTLDDDRFEVVNGQLKLKSGEFLNFENESSVNINITAEDSGNLTYNKLFTITVNDINEAPTNITLDNQSVNENASGEVIGNLSVTDVDNGDTFTYTVNDNRFEVINGQLKLKANQALDFEN
ncbi:choice-of-anchor Q domain-containing protein, partial [Crocosphaera watsonii]